MTKKSALDLLVERALNAGESTAIVSVVEKEILHYEILNSLDRHRLLNNLTFQGGTCLRLIYGALRLSEDLDFKGGSSFDTDGLDEIKHCLEADIAKKFSLSVTVKPPKPLVERGSPVLVKTWELSVITRPERKDVPRQRIKIEIDNSTALTRRTAVLANNYPDSTLGYLGQILFVEEKEEILADKLVAYVNSDYIRYRDLWDMAWLSQQHTAVIPDMVASKVKTFEIMDYAQRAQLRIQELPSIVKSQRFITQMMRFLPRAARQETIDRPEYLQYLIEANKQLLQRAVQSVANEKPIAPGFAP